MLSIPGIRAESADEAALQEMLHGSAGGVVKHWPGAPDLVVLDSVMIYREGAVGSYTATSEQLTDDEEKEMVADLTAGLRLLTGDAYVAFASVRHETVAAGTDTRVLRPGRIVAGRYRGVQKLAHTIGLGGTLTRPDGTITSAAILLDEQFDKTSGKRRLLRMHELGHALGYNHVQSRISIMNSNLGPEPTSFDRDAARVAFHLSALSSN
jgi:hypothetical protein